MEYRSYQDASQPVAVAGSCFVGASGVAEHHFMLRPTAYATFETQVEWLEEAYGNALAACGLSPQTAVWRRFLCSDLPNQAVALGSRRFATQHSLTEPCAVSWVCQPPREPAKVVLWAVHVSDPAGPLVKRQEGTSLTLSRGDLQHVWTSGLISTAAEPSYDQTHAILADYETLLTNRRLTWADHVIRTWLFVQNVDANYQGLVVARRELFTARGLTADTHYVASTGIEGTAADVAAKVLLDAYAIAGVRPEQVRYLHALDHLSPTHVYGVTFERGTSVDYQDRRQVLISGTASIDHRGEILHLGNVARQLDRTLENIGALLAQAGATLQDMAHFIVYVRDPSDSGFAFQQMRERFPDAPLEVVVARVCRPGWLIEIEGTATIPADNPDLPAF